MLVGSCTRWNRIVVSVLCMRRYWREIGAKTWWAWNRTVASKRRCQICSRGSIWLGKRVNVVLCCSSTSCIRRRAKINVSCDPNYVLQLSAPCTKEPHPPKQSYLLPWLKLEYEASIPCVDAEKTTLTPLPRDASWPRPVMLHNWRLLYLIRLVIILTISPRPQPRVKPVTQESLVVDQQLLRRLSLEEAGIHAKA